MCVYVIVCVCVCVEEDVEEEEDLYSWLCLQKYPSHTAPVVLVKIKSQLISFILGMKEH